MTDSGKLLRNVSAAAALCAAVPLLAGCGSARAGTGGSAGVAVAATRSASASTGGTHAVMQRPTDPRSWLIPDNVVSIRVVAFPAPTGEGCCPGPAGPGRQLAAISDRSKVALVVHQLDTLAYGMAAVPCPPENGGHLELDLYSAGHPKSPSATAVVNRVDCAGVLLSAPGRHFLNHQGSIFDDVVKELGLTFPAH